MPREIVHQGRKIRVAIETGVSAAGVPFRRDVILHPGAVAILPLIDEDHICLLRNERPAVGETLWEIPAGTLEPNEPIEVAAARELAEETGYTAKRLEKICVFYPSPGLLSEKTHLFVARDLTPGAMNLEPDEQMEPRIVPLAQAMEWALNGTILDAKTIIALLLWDKRQALPF